MLTAHLITVTLRFHSLTSRSMHTEHLLCTICLLRFMLIAQAIFFLDRGHMDRQTTNIVSFYSSSLLFSSTEKADSVFTRQAPLLLLNQMKSDLFFHANCMVYQSTYSYILLVPDIPRHYSEKLSP